MAILTKKLEKDMELMEQRLQVNTQSDSQKREKIIADAIRTASLPSEVQKSMAERIQQRLKSANTKQMSDEEDLRKRLTSVINTSDAVNMGTTMQRKTTDTGSTLYKGKMLG